MRVTIMTAIKVLSSTVACAGAGERMVNIKTTKP
jgi:hypothetical protein